MPKQSHPATKKELQSAKRLIKKARIRYEDRLFEIEKIWAKIKPHDYAHRQTLVKVTGELIEIDQSLKVWEDKLNN